jgi:hypothetical protein
MRIATEWKRFLIAFLGTLAAALALPSAVLTLFGGHFSLRSTCIFILGAAALSFAVNKRLLKRAHLPLESIFPEARTKSVCKAIKCPCDGALIGAVAQLARECYGKDTISRQAYEPLRVKNRYVLACLTSLDGKFLGYFDVIPLSSNFAEMFLNGKLRESDITHEDVVGEEAMASCEYVYLSGIAACNPKTQAGKRNSGILIWAMLKYLDHFYRFSKPLAFATAVTKDGERLLLDFGFSLASEATARRDKHAMYAMRLSHEDIAKSLACIPDLTHLCALDWAPSPQLYSPQGRRPPRLPPHCRLRIVDASGRKLRRIS